jgi:hypothetical protein
MLWHAEQDRAVKERVISELMVIKLNVGRIIEPQDRREK